MTLKPKTLKNATIIIPLGPDEDQLPALLSDLTQLPRETEIILVTCGDMVDNHPMVAGSLMIDRVRWIRSDQGRAQQQNAGAKVANRDFLWFLHADSRVTPENLHALETSLQKSPDALHYFHLKFKSDGPRGVVLNEWGTRFRSQVLGIPWGDQGFCLARKIFERIGRFPEDVPYGEDHLLIWHARQAGIRLRCTGDALVTSARKYHRHGWVSLTWKYQMLWIKQALPEVYKLLIIRLSNPKK